MGQEPSDSPLRTCTMRVRVGGSNDPAPFMPTHGDSTTKMGVLHLSTTIPHLGILIGPV